MSGNKFVFEQGTSLISYSYQIREGSSATFNIIPNVQGVKNIPINETNFPDAAFRYYVSNNFDTSKDGILDSEEIANWKKTTYSINKQQALCNNSYDFICTFFFHTCILFPFIYY